MLDKLLSTIAPHHCFGCGEIGTVLCAKCKNYITSRTYAFCVVCHSPSGSVNMCKNHRKLYKKAWCVSERTDTIERLIDAYKFDRSYAIFRVLAELLDERLPDLPENTQIVPIPTAPRNIRVRGYDHMLLVARELAKRRKIQTTSLLERKSNQTQHFAPNREARHRQAKSFFKISNRYEIDPEARYLLIDDIFTSGATVDAAAGCLRDAGAKYIDIAIIARQR